MSLGLAIIGIIMVLLVIGNVVQPQREIRLKQKSLFDRRWYVKDLPVGGYLIYVEVPE